MAIPFELIFLIFLVTIFTCTVLSWAFVILRLLLDSCCQMAPPEGRRQPPQDIETGPPSNPQPPVSRPMLLFSFQGRVSRTALLSRSTVLVVYSMNTQETGDQTYDVCAICLEKFHDGDQCRVLSGCKHVYHKFCIERWLAEAQNCPVCRLYI